MNIHDFNDVLLEQQYMRSAEYKRRAALRMHNPTPEETAAYNAKVYAERAARDAADPVATAARNRDMREIEGEIEEWKDEQAERSHERSLRNPS